MKKIGRGVALLMCIVLTVSVLAACSSGSGDNGNSGGNSSGGAPETTVIRMAYPANGHIFNAIAEQQGYLEDEGITVEYVQVATDDEVFKGIAEGRIDIASNSGTNLPLMMISDGMDLTIFGGYQLTGCLPIFTKVDTEWNGIEDLIGKKMACESNFFPISGPLLDMGYDPLRQIVWMPFEDQKDRIQAVKSGEADFGLVGTPLNYAIISDPELKICTYASDILPNYSCCRVEAKTEWVNANPNTVKALLRAWIRAMAYYDAHHDEAVMLMMDVTGESEEYLRAYMDNPHYDLNIGPMKNSVVRAWDYMGRLGVLSSGAAEINIEDHINTKLYKEALDECQAKYGDENPKFYERMQAQYARYNY
ncbi:MAG: ABC transporter substrate-binding protein [Mogibacterium sp.]|nr:ABC transporter substrate-binding protein [Mogibacterium sp.]